MSERRKRFVDDDANGIVVKMKDAFMPHVRQFGYMYELNMSNQAKNMEMFK